MSQSPIDEIRQLESRRVALVTETKEAALAQIHEQIAVLAELGFDYSLIAGAKRKSKSRVSKASSKPQGPCPICKFTTEPPHDKRQHKSQSPRAAFSNDELRAKGLTRINDDAVEDQNAGSAPAWPEPVAT